MKIRAVLTDLDGTLLEPDGTVHPEVCGALRRLAVLGVAVCPVSSKTPSELEALLGELELRAPSGFENGAGIRHSDGRLELDPGAVELPVLRSLLPGLRKRAAVPVESIEELSDAALARITGLSGAALGRVRQRLATLPLIADPEHDQALRDPLSELPELRLTRGNRFLHFQGNHDKADIVARLLESASGARGITVGLGDAPNDLDLLSRVDVAVIVPSEAGPHPVLRERLRGAVVAPAPHGAGWVAAVCALIEADDGEAGWALAFSKSAHGPVERGRARRSGAARRG